MAIKYLDGGRITGLSTDAKPDRSTSDTTEPISGWNVSIQAGSVFIETDTGSKYVHNGTAWIQQSFDSINESLGYGNGVPQRKHFVEWFTGSSIDSNRWGFGGSSGGTANSVTMNDAIDGGVELIAGSSGYNYVWLTTGISGTDDNDNQPHAALDYKRFSSKGATLICVLKFTSALSTFDESGVGFSTEGSGYTNRNNMVSCRVASSSTKYNLRSQISGTNYTLASNVAVDTSFHAMKIELGRGKNVSDASNQFGWGASDKLSIDGVLAAEHASVVNVNLEPNICCASNNNVTSTMNVTYLEAWNN